MMYDGKMNMITINYVMVFITDIISIITLLLFLLISIIATNKILLVILITIWFIYNRLTLLSLVW